MLLLIYLEGEHRAVPFNLALFRQAFAYRRTIQC